MAVIVYMHICTCICVTVYINSTKNIIDMYNQKHCGHAGNTGTCSVRAEDSCDLSATHPEGVMEGE